QSRFRRHRSPETAELLLRRLRRGSGIPEAARGYPGPKPRDLIRARSSEDLARDEPGEQAVLGREAVEAALLHEASAIEHVDPVRAADRAQSMGDDHSRDPQPRKARAHDGLRPVVE